VCCIGCFLCQHTLHICANAFKKILMVMPMAACQKQLISDFRCMTSALRCVICAAIRFKVIEMLKEYEMGPFQVRTSLC
jgi:hypothetical protein